MKKQTVFALWADDGYYYPAEVGESEGDLLCVSFLDGAEAQVEHEHIVELQETYQTMKFEADWEKKGEYNKCIITRTQPLTVEYEDETIESIDLSQLRGSLNKKKMRTQK